ncbi:MAG: putative motility protein [bacterium]|nr:putative motility protein [bacterium]
MMINNLSTVGFDTLSAAYPTQAGSGTSALKGANETHEMVHTNLSQMMKDVNPNLGQNIDIEV